MAVTLTVIHIGGMTATTATGPAMLPAPTTKPATLPAPAVGHVLLGLRENAIYRACKSGQLADGLPTFRAGGQRWLVSTALTEQLIGRPLTDEDVAALAQFEDQATTARRQRRQSDPANS